MPSFDHLIQDALAQDFSGWDFSAMRGRWHEESPPWDYRQLVQARLPHVDSLLDMGTGGGEFLASLSPLPPHTRATESWPPNVPIARQRLTPLGIEVRVPEADEALPFAEAEFELIINRHESICEPEVYRLLKPGGTFLTQQVGGKDNIRLNELIAGTDMGTFEGWQLTIEVARLETAGFQIIDQREAFSSTTFYDIGAVVFYLKAIPWQIEDFSAERYRDVLFALHQLIEREGGLVTQTHRFLIEARKV